MVYTAINSQELQPNTLSFCDTVYTSCFKIMNNIHTAWLHHKTSKHKNISTEKTILGSAKVCFKTNTKINPS